MKLNYIFILHIYLLGLLLFRTDWRRILYSVRVDALSEILTVFALNDGLCIL